MSYIYSNGGDDAADKVVKDALGDNPLAQSMDDEDEDQKKMRVFEEICDLTYAARDLYCEQDMPFDKVMDNLSDALLKLKGKEQDLMNASDDDNTDEEE